MTSWIDPMTMKARTERAPAWQLIHAFHTWKDLRDSERHALEQIITAARARLKELGDVD